MINTPAALHNLAAGAKTAARLRVDGSSRSQMAEIVGVRDRKMEGILPPAVKTDFEALSVIALVPTITIEGGIDLRKPTGGWI